MNAAVDPMPAKLEGLILHAVVCSLVPGRSDTVAAARWAIRRGWAIHRSADGRVNHPLIRMPERNSRTPSRGSVGTAPSTFSASRWELADSLTRWRR